MQSAAIQAPDPRPPAPTHDLDQAIWELAQLATNAADSLENLLSTFQTASSVHGRETVLSRLPPDVAKLVSTAADVKRYFPPGKSLTQRALTEVNHAADRWRINPGEIIGFFLNISQTFTILLNRLSKTTGWEQALTYLKRAKTQRTQSRSRGLSNTTNWLPRDVEVAIKLATESEGGTEEEPAQAAAQTTASATTRGPNESTPLTPATNPLSTRPASAPIIKRVDFTASDSEAYPLPNGRSFEEYEDYKDYEDNYNAAMPDANDDSGYQSSPSPAGSVQSLSYKKKDMGPPSANTRKRSAPASASASKRLKAAQSDSQDNVKSPKTSFQASNTTLPPRTTPSGGTNPSVTHPLSATATSDAGTGTPAAPGLGERALLGALMDQQWGDGLVIRDALRFIVSLRHNTFAAEPLVLGTERKDWTLGVANLDAKDDGSVLLCPIRCEDHHWVLIEARPGIRTARLYDSRSDCPTVESAVSDTLSRLDVLLNTWTPESPWNVAREACAQQMHERDDGIAIIANTFCALSKSALQSTLDSRAWRHTVAVLLGFMDDNDVADRFDRQMKDVTFERMMHKTTWVSGSAPAIPPLKDAPEYVKQLHEYVEAVKKQGLSAANANQSLLGQHLANVKSQQIIMRKLVDLGNGTVEDLSTQNACITAKIEETWQALGKARENPDAEWADGTGQSLDHLMLDRRKKSKAIHETMNVFARLECVLDSLESRADRYESVAKEVKVYEKSLEEA